MSTFGWYHHEDFHLVTQNVLPKRSGDGEIAGLSRSDGYLDLRQASNEEAARLLLERYQELQPGK